MDLRHMRGGRGDEGRKRYAGEGEGVHFPVIVPEERDRMSTRTSYSTTVPGTSYLRALGSILLVRSF